MKKFKNAFAALMVATAMTASILAVPVLAASDDTSSDTATSDEMPGDPPDGNGGGEMGDPPDGNGGSEMGDPPDGNGGEGGGFGGGANTSTYDYSGDLNGAVSTTDTLEVDGETVSATESDENAALVSDGGTLTITNSTLEKSGDDDDGDNCNFYGLNSILLAVNEGSTAYISDSSLSATSTGSNGIFSTDNATVYASNVTIATTSDNSRGLDATYGGTIVADNVTISTQGDHCAAVATDRGGGYISVTNSTFSTAGSGSPLLYSTGDIEVDGVTGTSTGSQIAGMEGLNTILIYNSDLTSTITEKTASDPVANGVIIYQSTSGDAETSTGDTATFEVYNSSLTSSIASGAMFYVTNTSVNMVIESSDINYDSDAADLLLITGNDDNGWGTAGSNGGTVTFTAIDQTLEGNIEVDTISSLDFYLTDGSTYTGAMYITENENGSTSESPINVYIDSTSTWVVTESCTISSLTAEDGAQIVDSEGNTVTIVADGQTVVEGTSDITVTVDSYSTDAVEGATLSTDYIDRTDFDSYFGTSTTFANLSSDSKTETVDSTEESTADETEEATEAATEETVAEETDETTTASETTDDSESSGTNTGLVAGGVAVVAAAAIAGIAVGKKKKSN